jgi:uncharacterized repeat protein (TIGR03803 family)
MKMLGLLAIVLVVPAGRFGGANAQTLTNLWEFTGGTDGATPVAALVQGSDGYFYGTTGNGGNTNTNPSGFGTVIRISPNGSLTNLHSFSNSDGADANGLVQGSNGNFYGTTYEGGNTNANPSGYGTVFRISPSGSLTNLHSFNGSDGAAPVGLVQGSDGNFYGVTVTGGINGPGYGTIFRISSNGSFTNLYSFTHGSDGAYPGAALVQGSDGNFYGTTQGGGAGWGTVFRISPNGSETNLHIFFNSDGASSYAGLVQGSDGNFYGTTGLGGTYNHGTVFKLTVSLNPPANQISAIQLVGTNIIFKIPSVAYETYQLQFSNSMTPTNWVNVPGVSVTNSIGGLLTLTNFGGALPPQQFYRIAITP